MNAKFDCTGVYLFGLHAGMLRWGYMIQVSSNQRGVNASQLNIAGTGLGSFNDRFRDAVVGGSPFASPLFQGWVTGMYVIVGNVISVYCRC